MPKPLAADWNLAQVLYVQGVPYADIAEKIGVTPPTLRQHARRHDWPGLRHNALASVSQVVAKTLSERVRDALGEEIERQTRLLLQHPPKGVPELLGRSQGRAGLVEQLVASAAKVCGWDRQQQVGLVIRGDVSELQMVQINSPSANPLLEPVALAVPGTPATA